MPYEFTKSEEAMLAFWKEHDVYAKARAQCASGEPYYFLDGPPYTSGKVHLGTAWNKALKDMVLRYKRMRGHDVWDRAGYDMHGLPTEHATQKQLQLTTKEDIERYGVAKFIDACKRLCVENMHVMNEDFARLGVWMDLEGAYQSITDEFIEGQWWLAKRAHEKQRLYEGLKTMTWCPECASALAKHECEYQTVNEPSIFVKLPIQGEEDAHLIIWTTTPWTIPFNLAVMVNPEIDYVRARVTVEGKTETWVLAKALAGPVVQSVANGTFEIEREFKGEDLEGTRYRHPFEHHIKDYEQIRTEAKRLHTVLLSSEYVDTSAGSGLVHCAPGCGPEDFEVGRMNGLPPYNTLDEVGAFPERMGIFAGKIAKKDDAFFIEQLRREGALIATVDVEHEYPHCWRHHTPVIFRATKQWFFKVEDIKDKLVAENDKITWVPEAAYNAFDSWLKNLRDNSITKQRYWGTPVPIWRCESCAHYVVVGSKAELQELAGKLPEDLHKPWIDTVTWTCHACTGAMRRIPDIFDVWVDAGTVSWNCLDYPQRDAEFKRLFPADFILEGKDQIRGWFNLLHICSMIAFDKPCFTHCYMHGFINDAQGRKMSKSLGNYILPEEVVKKYGANTFRYYAIGAASPGLDMNYNFDDVELKHRNLCVFWNVQQFLVEQRRLGVTPSIPDELGIEERYILSRLHSTIRDVTGAMESYRLNEVPMLVESLLLDLSREYLQFVRDRASHGSDEERATVLGVASAVFIEALKLFGIVVPMFAEDLYQRLREPFGLGEESIHLCAWPEADKALIDDALEQQMHRAADVISAALAARDAAKLGVRWPSKQLVVDTKDEAAKQAVAALGELIARQVNVKEVVCKPFPDAKASVKPEFKALGKEFGSRTADVIAVIHRNADRLAYADGAVELEGTIIQPHHYAIDWSAPEGWAIGSFPRGSVYLDTRLDRALEREGLAREVIRRVQQHRKESGLQREDRIVLQLALGEEGATDAFIAEQGEDIRVRCGAERIEKAADGGKECTVRGTKLRIGITKL